jgi:predicted DNA-binding antitoxin AbrB/MazE fold protein
MKVKGIFYKKGITLLEPIFIPEGTEVIVDIPDNYEQKKPQWNELEKVIGVWKDDQEITDIFAEIDMERHLDYGREINFDDQ